MSAVDLTSLLRDAGVTPSEAEVLRRPRALRAYRRLRRAAWMQALLESDCHIHRRLGAALIVREVLDVVDPRRDVERRERAKLAKRTSKRVERRAA